MCRACARSDHMCHQFVPLVRAFQLLLAQASLAAWSKVCKLEIFTSEPHRLLGFSSSCTEPAEESLTLYLLLVHTHGLGCWADVPSAFTANGINIDLKEKKQPNTAHTWSWAISLLEVCQWLPHVTWAPQIQIRSVTVFVCLLATNKNCLRR